MARGRENEPPMPEPLAYFLTWPTYGTWLPGDERGGFNMDAAGNSQTPSESWKPKQK